jgi:hypothetical protein
MFIDLWILGTIGAVVFLSWIIVLFLIIKIRKEGKPSVIGKLFDFLKDDSPYSTIRLAITYFTILFVPVYLYVWATISIQGKSIQEPSLTGFLFLCIFFFKMMEKRIENGYGLPSIPGSTPKKLEEPPITKIETTQETKVQ